MLPYTQSGSGNTLVLLHGFCEDKTCFNEQVFLLQHHFRIITLDLPGFGEAPVTHPIQIDHMADALFHTLEQLNIHTCVLCGHSMGGYVALAFAKKYSHMLKGLILLHSTAAADTDERKQKRDQAVAFIQTHGSAAYVKNFIPPLFAPAHRNEHYVAAGISAALSISPEGLTAALLAMKNRFDSLDWIQHTTQPVAYIAGRYDELIPVDMLMKQAVKLKKGYITVLENSAHMGMVEEPEACASALAEFTQYCFEC
jgi:pimeloyl-ACP methyl ester carboxylesterase